MSKTFRALLLEGLRKFAGAGFISEAELQEWMTRLHAALEVELPTDEESRKAISDILTGIYGREVNGLPNRISGVSRYTVDRVSPHLRAELDRRIFAGADLIRLNKRAAVEKTLQRFSGWISSVPRTGASETDLRSVATDIVKPVSQLKFEARRVAIDQGHKLSAAVAHVVASGNGAIAAIWHDRGEQDHGYDARPEHLARAGKAFLVRDSWAMNEGLIRKPAGVKYTDEIEAPAELPFCSCSYEYITTLNTLPREFLTGRGLAWVSGKPTDEYRADANRFPTLAQRNAGNYAMGHIRFQGLDITIETPKGAKRSGVGESGVSWSVTMPADYGYIRRTTGADDEHIDCYIGPNHQAGKVWVIQQGDPETRAFDEQKVMLGFNSRDLALDTYTHGFADGKGRLRIGDVIEMTLEQVKAQVNLGRTLIRAA